MFRFLQYVQPIWYYRLAHLSPAPLLTDYNQLSPQDATRIKLDPVYSDIHATHMDAAYQGLMRGIIPNTETAIDHQDIKEVSSVAANYRFIRKYFASHWYIYTYILRIITLHNPIRETRFFLKNLRTKKVDLFRDFTTTSSQIYFSLHSQPFVSVVIPTLNRYPYLKDVLSDLERQDYPNFEVLVCDQSEPVEESFYQGWNLDLTLIKQEEKALWLARNTCIQRAKGDLILLFDDDSRVEPDWIRRHLECLEQFGASVSAGVTHTLVGHGLSPKESYFHLSDVFDTGNAMVKREVFEKIGLFDRQFEKQRMGDGEFGLRALLAGHQLISNPYAKRIHLKVETGGLREMGSWDAFYPRKLWSPRPVPSTLYLARKYFGDRAATLMLLNTIPRSLTPYKYKGHKSMKIFGLFLLPLYLPFVLLQVRLSWRFSSKKLEEGARIGQLSVNLH